MTVSNSSIVTYSIVCTGASICLLYTLFVLIFLAMSHDITWTSMNAAILRSSIVFALSIWVFTILEKEKSNEILIILGVVFNLCSIWLIIQVYSGHVQGPTLKLKPDCMKDRVVLITGANSGIGKETAKQLLHVGATVIFACRNEARAKEAMNDIIRTSDSKSASNLLVDRMRFLKLDLSSVDSVRTAAENFQEMKLPLHVLINNGGIVMGRKEISTDGYEMMMACNHLGHFLLTNLLLPKLREANDARVITLSSATYAIVSQFDLDDLFCEKERTFTMFGQYTQSKLANILFSSHLAKRELDYVDASKGATNGPITCYAVHPGVVQTEITKNMPWWARYGSVCVSYLLATVMKSPSAGARTSVWCATSEQVREFNGLYFANSSVTPLRTSAAKDEEVAKKLWDKSEQLVGLSKK